MFELDAIENSFNVAEFNINETLDFCQEAFDDAPSRETGNKLLDVAREYADDDMISEDELYSIEAYVLQTLGY